MQQRVDIHTYIHTYINHSYIHSYILSYIHIYIYTNPPAPPHTHAYINARWPDLHGYCVQPMSSRTSVFTYAHSSSWNLPQQHRVQTRHRCVHKRQRPAAINACAASIIGSTDSGNGGSPVRRHVDHGSDPPDALDVARSDELHVRDNMPPLQPPPSLLLLLRDSKPICCSETCL